MTDASAKVPEPRSRFRQPTIVFYVPPWLRLGWTGGGSGDWAGPLVVEVPRLAVSIVWFAVRLLCYPFLVLGRIVALPFRPRPPG